MIQALHVIIGGYAKKEQGLSENSDSVFLIYTKLYSIRFFGKGTLFCITGGVILAVAAEVVILKVMNTDPLPNLFQNAKDAVIGEEGTVTTISKSSLEEVFEISELSVNLQHWNAIITMWQNPRKQKVLDWHMWEKKKENSGANTPDLPRLELTCWM